MISRIYASFALIALATSSAVTAQSFTYTSTASAPAMVVGGVAPDGRPFGAQSFSGTSDVTMAGKTVKNSFKCITMSQPANDSLFAYHMMCDIADPSGTSTSAWGCSAPVNGENNCIGRMVGQTGVYAKRVGTITGHTKGPTMSSGVGQWNE